MTDPIIDAEALSSLYGELSAAYRMLQECLPLARKTLVNGGVSLDRQQFFWLAYEQLSNYADADEEEGIDNPRGLITLADFYQECANKAADCSEIVELERDIARR